MRFLLVLLLLLSPGVFGLTPFVQGAGAATVASAPGAERCFAETGHCLRGVFHAYWLDNGALERQGYPITDEFDEVDAADGQTRRVQYFERARFEYHQEYVNTPYVVLLGALGRPEFAARYPQGRPPTSTPIAGASCFPQTGRCMQGAFRDYWERTGGLEQHGYPLSDEFVERSGSDGRDYVVQYFERARFEYHPEFVGTPSVVLLGLIGAQHFAERYPQGQPTVQTGPAINVWAATTGAINPALADIPPRVYVPDEARGDITVIDPATFQVVDRYPSGTTAHHVGPGPDFTKLYVNNVTLSPV